MAKYKASPQYTVGTITFNAFGLYETDIAKEITALDALAPTWVTRIDERPDKPAPVVKETKEPEEKTEEAKAPVKPAAKPKAAKSSAK